MTKSAQLSHPMRAAVERACSEYASDRSCSAAFALIGYARRGLLAPRHDALSAYEQGPGDNTPKVAPDEMLSTLVGEEAPSRLFYGFLRAAAQLAFEFNLEREAEWITRQ